MTRPSITDGLEAMLAELQCNRLEVALTPCRKYANVGGCVRTVISRNCDWYRKFCAKHSSSRRRNNAAPDTRIKRRDTVRLLERMIAGRPTRSKYAEELRTTARKLIEQQELCPF